MSDQDTLVSPRTPAPDPSPPPAGPQYSLGVVLGAFALGVVIVLLLIGAIYGVSRIMAANRAPEPTATATLLVLPTQAAQIPTTTPAPTQTETPPPTETLAPSPTATLDAAEAVTATQASSQATAALAGNVLTVDVGANVRNGPGTNYNVIGNLAAGATADVIGRNSNGSWFAIEYSQTASGRAWISSLVSTYDGNVNSLDVIAAPPPPAATAPPVPATSPASPGGGIVTAGGLSGRLTLCAARTTYGVGERICFIEWIRNNTAGAISYGILGVQAANLAGGGQFQTSWSGELAEGGVLGIDAGCEGPVDRCNGPWEDGMRLNAPGTYRLTMQLCLSTFSQCLGDDGQWVTLSAPIVVTIQ